jgi:hypothetical protein
MAENNEKSVNFSIEDTMDTGIGNAELIKDLMAPESVSGDADDLTPVDDETSKAEKKEIKKEVKKKEAKKEESSSEEKEEEESSEKNQDIISEFLKEGEQTEEKPDVDESHKGEEESADETKQETSSFTALANDLYKLGVFTKDEDEDEAPITTPQEFLEKFQNEKKKGATEAIQAFIGQFGEDYQNAFEAIYVKGANPKEYFSAYNSIVDYAQMDMTKEQNQEAVVRQALADQGFEAEDINTEIERVKNYGDLETVAAKHHKVLVKKEALKLQQIEQKAEEELRQKTLIRNQYITNVQKILQDKLKEKEFDGIPINPKLANELQDFLLVDKWKTASGETLTDFDRAILELKRPENHINKVKVGLLLKIMEKDPTLSVIQKSGITKKTDQMFSEVAKQVTKNKSVGVTKPTSWFQH